MFIPRSIKRKQRDFIDSHDIHFNKKQALDNGQTKSNPSTTVATTIAQQKEENTIENIPKEDQTSNTHSINYSKNDDVHTDTSIINGPCLMTNNEIKQFSSQQRLIQPNQDEPTCIVCGKYGEYINDNTDHDVCSMECKYIDTDITPISMSKSAIKKKEEINNIRLKIPQPYTANNIHAKYTNYMEPESVQALTSSDTKAILKANGIQVNGSRLPRPITSFDQCYTTFGEQLYKNIENELGWHMATPLQRMVIPIGLAGRDMIVTAPTHSGKTGSYLIPLIVHCQTLNRLHQYKRRGGPYALIIAPTRELCQQIESITKKLITQLRCLRTGLLIGGQPIAQQLYRLRKGVQIIIGTPGRLVEIATHHPALLRLWMLRIIVLDEADAIFGLGFEKQMKLIFQKLSTHATIQKCVFSATLSENDSLVQKKIQPYFNNNNDDDPVQIKLQSDDEYDDDEMKKKLYDRQQQIKTTSLLPSPLVRQTILWVENDKKAKRLYSILNNPKYFLPPILIFVESRLGAEFLSRAIQKRYSSWRVVTMHADKDQHERMAVIEGMNQKDSNELATWDIVVTTDILARGVDLPCVRLVINYDMAATEEDYIHRIGRAILPGSLPRFKNQYQQHRGWAITFINKEHEYLLPRFTKMLSNKSLHQVTPLPSQLKKYL